MKVQFMRTTILLFSLYRYWLTGLQVSSDTLISLSFLSFTSFCHHLSLVSFPSRSRNNPAYPTVTQTTFLHFISLPLSFFNFLVLNIDSPVSLVSGGTSMDTTISIPTIHLCTISIFISAFSFEFQSSVL